MAESLKIAGHTIHGYDVNAEMAARFAAEGGASGALTEVAGSLDAVLVVVLNAAQARAVLFAPDGVVPHLTQGAVVICSPTVQPAFAREMEAACGASGVQYLGSPISGGSAKAAMGRLSVMAAGTPEAFVAARPVLDACAETLFTPGDSAGPGSAMKAVNQFLAGVHVAAMAEAMTFGVTQGITPQTFLEMIPKCADTSWTLENRAPHVSEGDYTPHSAVDIWPKDLGIVIDIAREDRFSAPLAVAAMQQFLTAPGMGRGREDDAVVAKVYARSAGLSLPEKSR